MIAEISHIATLPEITLKIIHLVENPESTAQDLNKVITHDPALGSRILKVVNSGFYGLPGQIGSISQAIGLLGLNAVKTIAIAASLAKLFRGGQICPSFSARDLWTHSIAVATGAKLLADQIGCRQRDEAFLSGLLHDVGIMIEMQVRRRQLVEAIDNVNRDTALAFRDAETAAIGASHEQFGAALCRAWRFPDCFAHVTGYHHRPLELEAEDAALPALVHVADIVAARTRIGYSRTVESVLIDPAIADILKLREDSVSEITQALPAATEEAASLLRG